MDRRSAINVAFGGDFNLDQKITVGGQRGRVGTIGTGTGIYIKAAGTETAIMGASRQGAFGSRGSTFSSVP